MSDWKVSPSEIDNYIERDDSDDKDYDAWTNWDCPECGEDHEDPKYWHTHCRKCGLVVLVSDGYAISEHYYVEPERTNYLSTKESDQS